VEAAKARGLNVIRFPFHDGGIPKDMDATVRLIEDIIDLSNKGERLCIHCNGGLGRAGMIAACVRLALGLEANPEHAIAMVRKLRSHRAIETIAQERFVGRFHIAWHGKQS
jgi:protein-tyrosine phosphatase